MPEGIEVNSVYRHYSGKRYMVMCVADDATNVRDGNKIVVYAPVDASGPLYCRDLLEFVEVVEWPDGTRKPRFVLA